MIVTGKPRIRYIGQQWLAVLGCFHAFGATPMTAYAKLMVYLADQRVGLRGMP